MRFDDPPADSWLKGKISSVEKKVKERHNPFPTVRVNCAVVCISLYSEIIRWFEYYTPMEITIGNCLTRNKINEDDSDISDGKNLAIYLLKFKESEK